MPPRRTLIAIAVSGTVAVLGVAFAGWVLLRGEDVAADGDLIAYSCKEQHNVWYAICVSKVDGSERRRLTKGLATSTPMWSPDGRRIAFTRKEDIGDYMTYSDDDIFVMDADGDNVKQLTAEREGRHADRPTWSPDGVQIAYVDGGSVASGQPSRPGNLRMMNSDGTEMRELTRGEADTDPAWSPDGNSIAYGHCFNIDSPTLCTLDLFVLDLATGRQRQLTRTPGFYEAGPSWSPDGSQIAFTRWVAPAFISGSASVHLINRDGSGERLILKHPEFLGGLHSLSWSPDGETIAFVTSPNRACTSISLVTVRSGVVRSLTSCERERESTRSPAWQPIRDKQR